MPKQLNVKLGFTADTSQARRDIQSLQNELSKLSYNSLNNKELSLTTDVKEATAAVAQLQAQLHQATNLDTGALDLGKFSYALKQSGMTMSKYAEQLSALGPAGNAAFNNLAKVVTNAEIPLLRLNGLLDGVWTSLKNSARWQFSSSVIHGFIGAIQGAYGYAQDLDKSLNSIRIITGDSAEKMAELAENANKAAQSLSTSTLAYTDAALIYYQQGLNDEEVAARTETTLKMSNVTGESAEEVSSYMTAIWNNFAQGSDNLELFADKITALGAATASSSAEIAGGLQQFAAIANTVGLSYDYAATALATVVAQTRQSESTVGNAFRTIFSRLEGLQMGETLEDGTDLNKYSNALATIGVNIKDQNGDLKQMDQILEEIGARWQTLSRDQQMALAQTVGGVRQYANLIALFDNWDKFQKNLQVAQGAEGTLEKQARIYAESWEAARKRVRAAWEEIYKDLIDEDFFKDLLNNLSGILNTVDDLIKSMGGLKGAIAGVVSVASTLFAPQLTRSLEKISEDIWKMSSAGRKKQLQDKKEAWQASLDTLTKGESTAAEGDVNTVQAQLQTGLLNNADRWNTEQLLAYEQQVKQITEALGDQYLQQVKIEEKIHDQIAELTTEENLLKGQLRATATFEPGKSWNDLNEELTVFEEKAVNINKEVSDISVLINSLQTRKFEDINKILSSYLKQGKFSSSIEESGLSKEFAKQILNGVKQGEELSEEELQNFITQLSSRSIRLASEIPGDIEGLSEKYGVQKELLEEIIQKTQERLGLEGQLPELEERTGQAYRIMTQRARELNEEMNSVNIQTVSFSQSLVSAAQLISSITFAISSLTSLPALWKAEDVSNGDKILRTIMTFGMVLPTIIKTIEAFRDVQKVNNLLSIFNLGITKEHAKTVAAFAIAKAKEAGTYSKENEALIINNALLKEQYMTLLFTNPLITAMAVAIGVVVAGIALWNKAEKEAIKARKEEADELSKVNKENQETLETNEKLIDSYLDLYEQYKKGKDVKDELNSVTKELTQNYDLEGAAIARLTGNYDNLTKSIKQARAEELQNQIDQSEETIEAQSVAMIDAARGGLFDSSFLSGDTFYWNPTGGAPKIQNEKVRTIAEKYSGNEKGTFSVDVNNTEEIIQYYETLEQMFEEMDNSLTNQEKLNDNYYLSTKRQLDLMKDIYGEVDSARENLYQATLEQSTLGLDFDKALNQDQFDSKIEKLRTLLKESHIPEDVIDSLVEQTLRELADSGSRLALNQLSMAEGYNQDYLNAQTASHYAGTGMDPILTAGDELADNQEISEDSLKALKQELQNLTGLYNENITAAEEWKEVSTRSIIDQIEWLSQLREAHQLSAEEQVENQRKATEALIEEKERELEEAQKEQRRAQSEQNSYIGEAGSEEIKTLQENVDKAKQRVESLTESLGDLQEQLEDINSRDYFENFLLEDFDNAVDSILNKADALKTAAEMIGEGFVVAKEDAESFGNIYPELLQDAEVLADGSIQLNKETVQAILNGNSAVIQGDKQVTEQQLEDKIALVDAELQYQQTKLEILESLLSGEISRAEAEQRLNAATEEFKTQMVDTFGDNYAQAININVMNNASGINAMLEDLGQLDDYISEISEHYSKMMSGEVVSSSSGAHVAVGGSKVSYNRQGNGKISNDLTSENVAAIQEQIAATKQSINLLSQQRGQYTTLLSKLRGGVNNAVTAMDNAASGLGGKYDPSSGGGGGSRSQKDLKDYEKEEDRYHNIKSAIDEVTRSLKNLEKAKDRAYGKSKLKYMDAEIDKLQDQVRLTDMYIDEAKQYLAFDRGRLEGIGMGAQFTEDGRLLNYEQVLQNIVGSYNGAISSYNSAVNAYNAGADESIMDAADEQLKTAEKTYKENQEILKQYEDTYKELLDQVDNKIELLNQIYDAKLAKVKWKVDIQLEVNDADLEVLDWINKYIQKDSKKAADSIANLSKQMGLFGKNITAVNGGLDELFENHGIQNYEDLTAEQLVDRLRSWQNAEGLGSEITQAEADQIREWMTSLMGYADDMLEAFEEAHEQVDKALDSWNDKLDEQIQKFDDLRDFLDSYNDIINLTGQRMLGMSDQDLADIDRSIVSNSQNRLESLRRIMEENQNNLNRMRAVDTSGYTEDALREWEENVKHAEEVATESTKNYWDGFKQSLEDGETAYNNAMDRMAAQYKRTLGNLDFLSERFSRQQEVDHLYLDDYEKYNAINKDMAELSKNLEKTNNLALKSKIKDFQDELNDAMSTGVRISQRQADIYEKRVALLQAEAELLNAQNAKSAVRMTRDNEGNFSYTYTADQDAIDAAEENYSTSFYDYLKYMRDNQEELQNEQIQKMSQYMDDLTALYQAFYDGEITDLDAALAELNAQYDEYREYFIDQETMLFDEMGRLRDEDWEFAQEITGLKLAEEDDFITDFSDTLVGRLEPTYQTAEGWAMEWAEAIADSNTSARESLNLWYQDVNTTYKAAGTTVDNFRDLVKADLTAINQASNDTKTVTDQMAIAMDNDMNNVIKKAVDMDRYWSTVMNDVRNQIEATVLKMNDMLRQLANIEDYEYRAGTGAEVARGAFAGMGDAAGSAVNPINNMADALNNAAGAARNLRDALNGGDTPDNNNNNKSHITSIYGGPNKGGVAVWNDNGSYTLKKNTGSLWSTAAQNAEFEKYFASGATGMYTGAWGSEGKLAILHEKELVLNKEDTANILSVVDTVRGLANNFDISNGLNQFAKSILGSSQLAMAGTGSLDQNVHIEANFPNVESHNEIEMALNNLINSASQYVNRK